MIGGGVATVYVSDLARAVRFYVEVLGFKLVVSTPGWAELDAGEGLRIGLHVAHPGAPKPGARGSISLGLRVTRPLADVVAILENRGVKFDAGIRETEAIRLASFADPDGNAFYLSEPKKK